MNKSTTILFIACLLGGCGSDRDQCMERAEAKFEICEIETGDKNACLATRQESAKFCAEAYDS